MKPDKQDVLQLVIALFTLISSLERAKRHKQQAGILDLLQIIASRPGVNPSEIAAELDLNQSSITRKVRTLEDAGHVAVVANQQDRRSCRITLTSKGQDELKRLTEIGLGRFAKFVENWDAEEVRSLARLLSKLEQSKGEVAQHEKHPGGRRWQH
ncbi:MAG: MarR family transcriptional regulator [Terracidiphilus sp.]|jgi:DNA-binding MarR family transcriptional regulator